ncbi:ABC transporter substrate-binding protein [Kineosporia sp. A_224]|uniref:ABC transporter substrate-binding protein n=1 Tax=Kineosporia sp. A_224 TaxID=1962180 RepID=UPI000B4A8679|nr:ABC transporter substrate-binding protein [Kineosporia sp. A_224]
MVKRKPGAIAAVAAGALLTLAACSGGSSTGTGGETASSGSGDSKAGGTLNVFSGGDKIAHLDPQRNYTGVDLAFAGTFLHRSLTTYATGEGEAGTKIVPDLATDTGTPDATGKVWKFTLRDGITFEDGSAITCDDVKYGVSRSFAQDVITDGPQYAVSMLDVPKDKDGASIYTGPYKNTPEGVAAYDKAVTCEGKTITFNLNKPVPDYAGTTTLLTYSPVPKAKDTGEKYDMAPVSSGPYKIESYVEKKALTLVRNTAWKKESDPVRNAFPDKVVMSFSINPQVIDQRLIKSTGDDAFAVTAEGIDPADLATVFDNPQNAARATDQLDPFVRYYAINTKKVPNVKHRQALMAALDREALRKLAGGTFAGDFADGAVKPNIGIDYAPTGLWDGLLGEAVPPTGNVELAKKLIAEAGEAPPEITFDYGKAKDDQTADKAAAIAKASWEKAGFKVKLNPIEQSAYYPTVLDPAKQGSVSGAGWGPDWLNASTVIPELFTPTGGFPMSQWDDKTFVAAVDDAKTTLDRNEQAKKWQELNKQAVQLGLIIPTRFGKEQEIFGSKVKTASFGGKPYINPAFGGPSWNDLYLVK